MLLPYASRQIAMRDLHLYVLIAHSATVVHAIPELRVSLSVCLVEASGLFTMSSFLYKSAFDVAFFSSFFVSLGCEVIPLIGRSPPPFNEKKKSIIHSINLARGAHKETWVFFFIFHR